MNYQDLVARAIAVKAADLEMGLSRAREQRSFIEGVSRALDAAQAVYVVKMDRNFRAAFEVEDSARTAAQRELAARFAVFHAPEGGGTLEVCDGGFACRMMFKEA